MEAGPSARLNVTLDPEHAAKLRVLAERTHVQEGTLARSLLSSAIDDADLDAATVLDVLDSIPGALARAREGERQAHAGETVGLDDLA